MMRPTINVRWTRLDPNMVIAAAMAAETDVLMTAKQMVRSILVRNLGTQYFTLGQLRQLGHPYSYSGSGRPGGLPAGVVNLQSGGFYSSFYVRGPFNTGQRISLLVGQRDNGSGLGSMLAEGTERMRGRPWEEHLRSELNRTVVPYLRTTLEQQVRLTVRRYV